MSKVTRVMRCTPDDVWAVLSDGWIFANWVVGAARIRDVERGWPDTGTKIHHSVGVWPLMLSDNTEVEHSDRPNVLRLRVRAWPSGEGVVTIHTQPHPDGTEVVMEEIGVSGPAKLLPGLVQTVLLIPRNKESLKRLAYIAEGRSRNSG
jgi:hypothetical protein